jgi:hypothetical protein
VWAPEVTTVAAQNQAGDYDDIRVAAAVDNWRERNARKWTD